jgi:hypothetical protein
MSTLNKRAKIMFVTLIISSVVMFASIFALSYKIMGLGLLQFTIVVFLSVYFNLKGRVTPADFVNYNFDTADKHLKDKNYVRATVYGVATPMLVVGILTLCGMLFCAIFFLD